MGLKLLIEQLIALEKETGDVPVVAWNGLGGYSESSAHVSFMRANGEGVFMPSTLEQGEPVVLIQETRFFK